MTAVAVSLDPRIPFTRDTLVADNARVSSHAHAEPAGRSADQARSRRLVSLEVVTAARDGDRNAMGRLCTTIYPRLVGFYRYSGLVPHEADDLASDVIEDVITSIATLRKPAAFDAWVWSIGRNRLKGWIRANRRIDRPEPITPAAAGPEERAIESDDHSRIRAALSMLSVRDRELLWLRDVEGLSYAEIGGRFGAAVGTIRVACHRARRRLEDAYMMEGDRCSE